MVVEKDHIMINRGDDNVLHSLKHFMVWTDYIDIPVRSATLGVQCWDLICITLSSDDVALDGLHFKVHGLWFDRESIAVLTHPRDSTVSYTGECMAFEDVKWPKEHVLVCKRLRKSNQSTYDSFMTSHFTVYQSAVVADQ